MTILGILIQGPYTPSTKFLVQELYKLDPKFNLVLSCYNEEIDPGLENYCRIVRSVDPGTIAPPPRGKPLNLKRQATTTFNGCKYIKEPWVLKIRSDLQITDIYKFKSFLSASLFEISSNKEIKLISLNTGCLDIFSYYQMPLHFNDWMFISRTETLAKNTAEILKLDENSLVGFDTSGPPKNYRHHKKYLLKFHVEQMIHFGSALNRGYWLKFCCDLSSSGRLRHIIWVGKHLFLFDIEEVGIKSTKVGLPSKASHFVSLTPLTVRFHSKIVQNRRYKRTFYFFILKALSRIRGTIFLSYKTVSTLRLFLISKIQILFEITGIR